MFGRTKEKPRGSGMKARFWMIAGAAAALTAGSAAAQVPQDIEAKLREIGRVISPVESAKLYRPLFTAGLPADVNVTRDVAFGPDPKQVLNVYEPAQHGAARPVLIFVPGGQGLKQMGGPEGEPFYDNMGAWGVKNGLVVVTTQYRTGGGAPWDAGARDLASTIQWVKANAARHGGDPNRVFIFGQSNGATQLATFLGHRELQGPNGPGVKGAVLMSGNWNILPLRLKSPPARFVLGGPGGPPAGGPPGGAPGGGPPPVDPAGKLPRSNLEGL
jgi:triacylglycerol lipase